MRLKSGTGVILVLICALAISESRAHDKPGDKPGNRARPQLLAHYMPWFESKEHSGKWGWHWTMGRFDPDRMDSAGKRDIASHDYPLIGPYDSSDPYVLEYHALLMKISGIDGVLVDWYGPEDFNDYAMIHRRTGLLFDVLKRRGLKFAVCYEDRVLKVMAEHGKLTPAQAVEHGREHIRYCDEHWFTEPQYVTWNNRPLLLVFGPEYLNPTQWDTVFTGMRRPPAFFTLHDRRRPAIGSFAWPPMWRSQEGVLDRKELDQYLDQFYKQDNVTIGGAFPGFHDIYQQAGVQPSHGRLDARKGETFRHTLKRALDSGSPFIQIITWNDFGEGTNVEPTREHEYRDLEAIQEARRRFPDGSFSYGPADLRLPHRIYRLHQRIPPSSAERRKRVDEMVDLLFAGDTAQVSRRLNELEKLVY